MKQTGTVLAEFAVISDLAMDMPRWTGDLMFLALSFAIGTAF